MKFVHELPCQLCDAFWNMY